MLVAFIVLVAVPLLVLIGLGGAAAEQPWVKGAVEIGGGPRGTRRYAPTSCHSGRGWEGGPFFGVVLEAAGSPATMIRVVSGDAGASVVVLGARGSAAEPWQTVTLAQATCPALVVEVERRGRRGQRLGGRADVDCRLPDGSRALGAVTFGECR